MVVGQTIITKYYPSLGEIVRKRSFMQKKILRTKNVSIEFPGVKALDNIDFEVETGEILAVVGANGAGKSTLMKVLSGANPSYTGDVYINDNLVELRNPVISKKMGIQIVYQEVDTALVPTLSVAENVMLNELVMDKHNTFVDWNKLRVSAREVLKRLNIDINVKTLVSELSLAQKQMVLIARAIQSECDFLILDEPTAPLSDKETVKLFELLTHLRENENIAIIFISHRINEIIEICEKYSVMRNGKMIGTYPINDKTSIKEIVEKMLGKTFEENFPKEEVNLGEKVFEVNNLSAEEGKLKDISLYVRSGEIVGIAGLVGAGKSELCKALFGAYKRTGGNVMLKGKELKLSNPSKAVQEGIALVPEERRKEGVLVEESVSFNLSAACLDKFCNLSFVNPKKVADNANDFVKNLGIKTPSIKQLVRNLSGGNQQKVVVGKWLAADCEVYIFDEPTKGVDVGAKNEIFHLISEIAKRGKAVIYASCENQELLSLTDRVYVMYDGQIKGEFSTKELDEDMIMNFAVGGKK